jgi:hypothetical protein
MMCEPCKTAGRLLAKARAVNASLTIFPIAEQHKLCEALTTCSCQHRVRFDTANIKKVGKENASESTNDQAGSSAKKGEHIGISG